ncbi:phosphate acyltransferase [Acidaminobacter sp.]|uniref:phosphate acyltransferase n=1 Tax=Acidaminobacter sp. TaxID=1872102 RepID=UPI0025BDCDE2|nr:phosphate acyltransferase [Acidaminobacter sp.]
MGSGMMRNFGELIEAAKSAPRSVISVAGAEDRAVLEAVKLAEELGFVRSILVGRHAGIESLAKEVGLTDYEIVEAETPEEAVEAAVQAVREGRASILMKGFVNTSVYMRGILSRDRGLRTGRLLSLLAVYEVPGYHKLIYASDSGVNVSPDLAQKKDILANSVLALKTIGIPEPKVAALTANEMVDPKVVSTVDAAALVEAVRSGELPSCVIEGPVAFDVAFDAEAARHKGVESRIAGDVDLLIFPNIETGNVLGKSWLHFNKAKWAGIILGASHPVVLGSRSDTAEIKLNSIALAHLAANLQL